MGITKLFLIVTLKSFVHTLNTGQTDTQTGWNLYPWPLMWEGKMKSEDPLIISLDDVNVRLSTVDCDDYDRPDMTPFINKLTCVKP